MSDKCACPGSQHFYSASAYGFSSELMRPAHHSTGTIAATILGVDGGHATNRVRDFKVDGHLSVEDTHTEVGGSYDACHNIHTTYAYAALEGVNVADVLMADRIVSRLYIYTPADPHDKSESSFTITGSHFENLRIAGYKVDVQLATSVFHVYDTFSSVSKAHRSAEADKWMLGGKLAELKADELQELENTYHALKGMCGLISGWKQTAPKRTERAAYFFSPANELTLEGCNGSDIQVFGNIICIPKFGVIRLAELEVHRHARMLTMFRVHMCSGHRGSTSGGGTSGGGGTSSGGGG
jgi:hypothetical protein